MPRIRRTGSCRRPAGSTIFALRASDVRIETGVEEGDDGRPYYDPMIAKLVATAPTASEAIDGAGRCAAARSRSGRSGPMPPSCARCSPHADFARRRRRRPASSPRSIDRLAERPTPTPGRCLASRGGASRFRRHGRRDEAGSMGLAAGLPPSADDRPTWLSLATRGRGRHRSALATASSARWRPRAGLTATR